MSIDERELRARLEQAAAMAGPPRLTTKDLARQVRRIRLRRGRAAIAGAASLAAIASAIAIPLALSPAGPASQPPAAGFTGSPGGIGLAPEILPRLIFTVTVNGRTLADGLFAVTPGEKLTMTVTVTVPRYPITALWLGIVNGALTGSHANMSPVLAASTSAPLQPGVHHFALRWIVPATLKPGTGPQLAAGWTTSRPVPGESETTVANFAVPLPPAAMTRTAVADRLRAAVLHDVANCGGTKPAWIRAVRTTFSAAMAFPGVSQGDTMTENGTDAVYLVLMKGDFILDTGQLPHAFAAVCAHTAGHYLIAMFDARTLVNLLTGMGKRPFQIPLGRLGPVLNITG